MRISDWSSDVCSSDLSERALYVVAGSVTINERQFSESDMPIFASDAAITLRAEQDAHLMLLGGEPVGARQIWWNFVASSAERLEQAKADWKAQRFDKVPGETEFIQIGRASCRARVCQYVKITVVAM